MTASNVMQVSGRITLPQNHSRVSALIAAAICFGSAGLVFFVASTERLSKKGESPPRFTHPSWNHAVGKWPLLIVGCLVALIGLCALYQAVMPRKKT